jgi:hypothetical protein
MVLPVWPIWRSAVSQPFWTSGREQPCIVTKVLSFLPDRDSAKSNLAYADIVVAGGLGMGSPENFQLVRQLASVLGAELPRGSVDLAALLLDEHPDVLVALEVRGQLLLGGRAACRAWRWSFGGLAHLMAPCRCPQNPRACATSSASSLG